MELIACAGCGKTTSDPDRWDPDAETGDIFCDACWDHRYGEGDRLWRVHFYDEAERG